MRDLEFCNASQNVVLYPANIVDLSLLTLNIIIQNGGGDLLWRLLE